MIALLLLFIEYATNAVRNAKFHTIDLHPPPPPSWQNSPDLNPVDYYVGSAMDRVYSTRI